MAKSHRKSNALAEFEENPYIAHGITEGLMFSSIRAHPIAALLHGGVLLLCCVGILRIAAKPGLGISYSEVDERIVCTHVASPPSKFLAGDRMVSIAGQQVRNVEDIEFLLDRHTVGTLVPCVVERDGTLRTLTISLVPYYGSLYLVIVILVSMLFYGVGIVVFLRRPGDRAARVFHLGAVGTAVMLSTTWGQYGTIPLEVGIGLRVVFSVMYAFVPVWFLRFASLFPRDRTPKHVWMFASLYGLAAVLSVANGVTFIRAADTGLVTDFHVHLQAFTATRWFLVALVVGGLLSVRHAYLTAGEEPERRRLRWVVWGLFVGFVPFVVLWVIPSIILSYGLVPEEVMLLFSGAIPLSFGISIVRYHILDIDLLLNRSVVYATVTAIIVGVYLALVLGVAAMVTTFTFEISLVISTGSAVLIALVFQPLRRTVQHHVDMRYFRVRYDYRKAAGELLEEIRRAPSETLLARKLIDRLARLLPTSLLAFVVDTKNDGTPTVLAWHGKPVEAVSELMAYLHEKTFGRPLPIAVDAAIEQGLACVTADSRLAAMWDLVIAVPVHSKQERILGYILLGPKESGHRFSSEDIDLLRGVASQAGLEIERLRLQRQLIVKEAEADRLLTLNALKSDFVSYVSHDLRTPLTSIKMYTELLKRHVAASDRKGRGFLTVVEGEADRLNRMVSTILDSARIEDGAVQYSFRDMDLLRTLKSVLRLLEYQLRKEGFRVERRFPRNRSRLTIHADPDAVGEAVMNLLTNAMKYGGEEKMITIVAAKRRDAIICSVRDRGAGISPEARPHVFEKFYRDPTLPRRLQGVGIGLSIVKHIMDAHGGRVEVESAVGKGSEITLVFPAPAPNTRKRSNENHPRY